MANRRMVAKSISVSDETNSIGDFAALLFTWLIPHADDYGVIPGSPGRIKALVVPRRSQGEAEVEAALEEMRAVGLIYRYSREGQPYIQLVSFDAHQEGLHKRTGPKNPLYQSPEEAGGCPETAGNSRPTEPNLSEPKSTETKRTKSKAEDSPALTAHPGSYAMAKLAAMAKEAMEDEQGRNHRAGCTGDGGLSGVPG